MATHLAVLRGIPRTNGTYSTMLRSIWEPCGGFWLPKILRSEVADVSGTGTTVATRRQNRTDPKSNLFLTGACTLRTISSLASRSVDFCKRQDDVQQRRIAITASPSKVADGCFHPPDGKAGNVGGSLTEDIPPRLPHRTTQLSDKELSFSEILPLFSRLNNSSYALYSRDAVLDHCPLLLSLRKQPQPRVVPVYFSV